MIFFYQKGYCVIINYMQQKTLELKDPGSTRQVNTIPLPYQRSLTREQLFPGGNPDYKLVQKYLKREGKLSKLLFLQLIKKSKSLFESEPNTIKIQDPVTIVGDIHGQFYDFIKLLDDVGGPLQGTKYLFLGDYVDRGCFSIEVLTLILCVKIRFHKTVFMLRGNHECRQMTSFFNFRSQCLYKYDQDVYEAIMDLFDVLPLAAVVNNNFLCIHGGLSKEIQTVADIDKVDRKREIPKNGILCDLVWADPVDHQAGKMYGFQKPNSSRGCSYYFGYELVHRFLQKNKITLIIRAHQAQANGFKMHKWGGQNQLPTVITIFSAPNYCDFYNNKGAVIKFKNNTFDIQQFLQSQHPYVLPNFIDAFQWSIPFLCEKTTALFYHLIKPIKKILEKDLVPIELIDKKQLLQKLLKLQHGKVEQNLQYVRSYHGRTLDNKLIASQQAKEYTQRKYKKNFGKKKEIDSQNEVRPQW